MITIFLYIAHEKCSSKGIHITKQVSYMPWIYIILQWRHNEHDSISNHQPHDCLLNLLFGRRSKRTSKLRVTGLCVWNSPGTGEFPAQRASNAENVSIWWRYHEIDVFFMTGDGETYDSAAINTNYIGCMCFLTVTVRTNMKRWPSNYSNTTWYTSRHLLGRKCGYFALSWYTI